MHKFKTFLLALVVLASCQNVDKKANNANTDSSQVSYDKRTPFVWENANVYFMMLDRFMNGNAANDTAVGRKKDAALLRNFEGGDLQGITQKIEEGYFDKLGVSAIWMTPPVEQVAGYIMEGNVRTYGYHGYWTWDWTNIDQSYGTIEDMKKMVQTAHQHGIRVLMDVVINHTGPATNTNGLWPDEWVRTTPVCTYKDWKTTMTCSLVEGLPDIRTEGTKPVDLPPSLVEKWKKEGRYEQEVKELDEFFKRTGYPRLPQYYIIKWLTDWVLELGIDGFRVDTVKHLEWAIWGDLKKEATRALKIWKDQNPALKLDDEEFFMTGELYGYSIGHGRKYTVAEGQEEVDYFNYGFRSLINFAFKADANKPYDSLFASYSEMLQKPDFKGNTVLNYVSSHDDGGPFDKKRERAFEAGTKLLLTPGGSQIYYGDETARILEVDGAINDANLRSFMNWDALKNKSKQHNYTIDSVFNHWCKLGQFRREHVSVGAGVHSVLQAKPFVFKREYKEKGFDDAVIVAIDDTQSKSLEIDVKQTFADGTVVKDYYSGAQETVKEGKVTFAPINGLLLIGKPYKP